MWPACAVVPCMRKARISALGFAPVGNAPGIDGLAGRLQGDAEGFALDIDPASNDALRLATRLRRRA